MVNKQELIDAMETLRIAIQGDIQAENSKLKSEIQVHMKAESSKLKSEMVSAVKAAIETSESKMKQQIIESEAKVQVKIVGMENKLTELEGNMMSAVHEELHQMEIRKKSTAVFGMKEEEETGETDETVCRKLLEEIGATADFQSYRTGPKVPGRQQTIIMKFLTVAQKEKVLDKAKNLKGKEKYKRITLAQDQTKQQRELSKKKELILKAEAEKRNASLTEQQKKQLGTWVVWGRGEGRRLVRKKIN